MASQITTTIAVWGAVIGTLTFVWNIVKWRHEKPQISACIEALESFSNDNSYRGVRLTIRNRGGKKTTVEKIVLFRRPTWDEFGVLSLFLFLKREAAWEQSLVGSHWKTAVLPVVLDVNGVWEGFIPLEASDEEDDEEMRQVETSRSLAESLRMGKVRYSIVCSHTNTRKSGLIQRERF